MDALEQRARRVGKPVRPVGEWAPTRHELEAALMHSRMPEACQGTSKSSTQLDRINRGRLQGQTNRSVTSAESGIEARKMQSAKRKCAPAQHHPLDTGQDARSNRRRTVRKATLNLDTTTLDLTRPPSPPTPTPSPCVSSPLFSIPTVFQKRRTEKQQHRQRQPLPKQIKPHLITASSGALPTKVKAAGDIRFIPESPRRSRHNRSKLPESSSLPAGECRVDPASFIPSSSSRRTLAHSTLSKPTEKVATLLCPRPNHATFGNADDTPKPSPDSVPSPSFARDPLPNLLDSNEAAVPQATASALHDSAMFSPKNNHKSPIIVASSPVASDKLTVSLRPSPTDAFIEDLLLGKRPRASPSAQDSMLQNLHSANHAPVGDPQVLLPVGPRFLPSDLKLLPAFLCKPLATVYTTCSSLIVPPEYVAGFPHNHFEEQLAKDEWRIRKENLGNGRGGVECWIQGAGWPAKTFCVCGWLVGLDRREYSLTYHIDDGTAVLECQVLVKHLPDMSARKPSLKFIPDFHGALDEAQVDHPLDIAAKADHRLDPYRRPPTPVKNKSRHSTMRANYAPACGPVELEVLIEQYSLIPVGTVLCVSGHPRDLFGATKRVLEIESLSPMSDPNDEIRFRQRVIKSRQNKYARLFRLAEVWPDAMVEKLGSLKSVNSFDSRGNCCEPASVNQETAGPPKRLRLRKVEAIKLEEATFSLFMTYITHHVTTTYGTSQRPIGEVLNNNSQKKEGSSEFTLSDLINTPDLKSLIIKVIHKKEFDHLLQCQKTQPSTTGSTSSTRVVTSKAKPRLLMNAQNNESYADESSSRNLSVPRLTTSRCDLLSFESKLMSQELDRQINEQLTKAVHRLVVRGIVILSPESQDKFALPGLHNLGSFLCSLLVDPTTGPSVVDGPSNSLKLENIMSKLKRDEMWRWIHEDKVSEILEALVKAGHICKMFDGSDWKWALNK